MRRFWTRTALVGAGWGIVLWLLPGPGELLHSWPRRIAGPLTVDFDRTILLLVASIAWVLTCWALVIMALVAISQLPTIIGPTRRWWTPILAPLAEGASQLLPKILPRAARRMLFAAIGLGTLATSACGAADPQPSLDQPASAADHHSVVQIAPAEWEIDWPADNPYRGYSIDWQTGKDPVVDLLDTAGSGQTGPAPSYTTAENPSGAVTVGLDLPGLDSPGPNLPATNDPDTGEPATGPGAETADPSQVPAADEPPTALPTSVIVAPGDTLWSIAATELGPQVGPDEIDMRWRQWYSENEMTIGADPNLILPGMKLQPPPPLSASPVTTSTALLTAPLDDSSTVGKQ